MGDAVRGAIDVIAQLQSDLAAARATNRDLHRRTQKAERFRDRWKGGAWVIGKRLVEARRRRKAENDLIALAKMYGEACGELHRLWLALDWDDEAFGMYTFRRMRERAEAAEAEAAQLRSHLLQAEKSAEAMRPDPRVDTQVWAAARSLDAAKAEQPEWLWFAKEDSGGIPVARYSYGRWAKLPEQAPYVRADIALGIEARQGRDEGSVEDESPSALGGMPDPLSPEPQEAAAWPSGCIKPNSCARNRRCQYVQTPACRHFGKDLTADVEAALAAKAAPLPETGDKP